VARAAPVGKRAIHRAGPPGGRAGPGGSATLKHNYIGTEHILLGLLCAEEGVAARALEALGITLERVRAQVVRIVGSGEEVTSGQIPFTPRAKKVLELVRRAAFMLLELGGEPAAALGREPDSGDLLALLSALP
jgi:hypothetical protein